MYLIRLDLRVEKMGDGVPRENLSGRKSSSVGVKSRPVEVKSRRVEVKSWRVEVMVCRVELPFPKRFPKVVKN